MDKKPIVIHAPSQPRQPVNVPRHRLKATARHGNKATRKWIMRALRYAEIVEKDGIPTAEVYRQQFRDQDTMTRALRGEL